MSQTPKKNSWPETTWKNFSATRSHRMSGATPLRKKHRNDLPYWIEEINWLWHFQNPEPRLLLINQLIKSQQKPVSCLFRLNWKIEWKTSISILGKEEVFLLFPRLHLPRTSINSQDLFLSRNFFFSLFPVISRYYFQSLSPGRFCQGKFWEFFF